MKTKNKSVLYKFMTITFAVLFFYSCINDTENVTITTIDGSPSSSSSTPLIINYKVPHDLPIGASEEDIANFAWNEFFALNWEAAWTEASPNRFEPNKSWTANKVTPTLAVWETYAHRTELRPANGMISKSLETGSPNYTFAKSDSISNKALLNNSKYWNVLDEDNEIGSAYLFANKNKSEVLYMAKTNLTEYNYLKTYYANSLSLTNATNKTKTLFGKLNKAQMCASDSLTTKGYVCLPCGDDGSENEGAIEIKLAFKKLDSTDIASRFITKKVVVFKKGHNYNGEILASVETLGLIGMHIIHKTKNYPTFIYASFEQVDVRNNNMQTIGIDTVEVNSNDYVDVDPHRLNPVIERTIPETIRTVNANAKALIKDLNPDSKWQYYQLIGAQARPTDYKNRNDDSNYFMANYVIESDLKLTNFHGSFSDPFDSEFENVALGKNQYNMGGCMGCHGNAQISGSDFSFLVSSPNFDKPDLYQTYQEALLSVTNSVGITVFAKKGWIDTGIAVKQGDAITYQYGKWTADPKTYSGKRYGANGGAPKMIAASGYALPGEAIGALVGKIGEYPAFLIGNGPTAIPANQSGILKLSINDDLKGKYGSGLKDNKGNLKVKIKIK